MIKDTEKYFKFFLITIYLLNSQFFLLAHNLERFHFFNNYHNKIGVTLLIIIVFSIWFINNFKTFKSDKLDVLIILFVFFTLILFLIQVTFNKESIFDLASNYYYTLIILLYFPLNKFISRNPENYNWTLNALIYIGIGFLISSILLYFFVANGYETNATLVHYVNGQLRLPQTSDLIGFTVLLMSIRITKKDTTNKEKLFFVSTILVSIGVLIFISNVRMVVLTCLMLLSFIVLIPIVKCLIKRFNKKNIIISLIGFLLIILFLVFKLDVINFFVGEGQKAASVLYRFEIIKYFKDHMFDNIIFGFGFSDSVKKIYSITDIGILGFFFKYGIVGITWIGLCVYYLIDKVIKKKNTSLILIVIYFVFTGISLSLFDSQRILYLPIILAFFNNSEREISYEEI